MNMHAPLRLSGAEEGLIAQLEAARAGHLAERLRENGLPTRRVEAYHYTDLKRLLGSVPPRAGRAIVGAGALRVPGAHRILIANGQVESAPEGPGIGVSVQPDPALAEREDLIVSLNRALTGETLSLTLSGDEAVVHLDRRMEGEAAHVVGGARIAVEAGAHAVIVETLTGSDAGHLGNWGTSVSLAEGARLTHVVLDRSGGRATQFGTLDYHLAENAHLTSLVVHAGAGLSRTQLFARFEGEGAHGDFRGLNLVDDGQHADITLDIDHAVPHTTSTERFKQVGRGRCKAVFQGKIVVARDAQKTDAQMMMAGLMLSENAEILAKPELEIFADDVVCAHGATCGDLDENWLFYLMSRGIPRAEAETMLVRGFLAEVSDGLDPESLAALVDGVIDHWLAARD